MIHEQTYALNIKVKGNSTLQMEVFEKMLITQVKAFSMKPNIKIVLKDDQGNVLNGDSFSFIPYVNGIAHPEYRKCT
jgi:hypothetical protein